MRVDEKNYEFRKKLLTVHKENIRDTSLTPESNEYEIPEGIVIKLPDKTDVILTAAQDFADYLVKSMGIGTMISKSTLYSFRKC